MTSTFVECPPISCVDYIALGMKPKINVKDFFYVEFSF